MQHRFALALSAVVAVCVSLLTACSVPIGQSNRLFTLSKPHVEVTQQQLSQYPRYGLVDFNIRSTSGRPLKVFVASIGYDGPQIGWLEALVVPPSDAVSVPVPRLDGWHPESVQISVYDGNKSLGAVRLLFSDVARPDVLGHGDVLTNNGQTIKLAGKGDVSFRITPHLADADQWRFHAVFIEDNGNSAHTY